jgi:hypothetical protein
LGSPGGRRGSARKPVIAFPVDPVLKKTDGSGLPVADDDLIQPESPEVRAGG